MEDQMGLKSEIARFFKLQVFSIRILMLNLFNLVFWILVIAGFRAGIQKGIEAHSCLVGAVAGTIGLAVGIAAGIVFLALFYWLYRRRELRGGGFHGESG